MSAVSNFDGHHEAGGGVINEFRASVASKYVASHLLLYLLFAIRARKVNCISTFDEFRVAKHISYIRVFWSSAFDSGKLNELKKSERSIFRVGLPTPISFSRKVFDLVHLIFNFRVPFFQKLCFIVIIKIVEDI